MEDEANERLRSETSERISDGTGSGGRAHCTGLYRCHWVEKSEMN